MDRAARRIVHVGDRLVTRKAMATRRYKVNAPVMSVAGRVDGYAVHAVIRDIGYVVSVPTDVERVDYG
jgi:hypothetical protein